MFEIDARKVLEMTYDEMVQLDVQYIEERSLLLDLKILVRTALGGFLSRNAY